MTRTPSPYTPFTLDGESLPEEMVRFVGDVVNAEYLCGLDAVKLTYREGRTMTVRLVQCSTHQCDRTAMVVTETWES